MRKFIRDCVSCMCSAQLSQGGEAKGEDRPENAGLKTRDAPIKTDMRDKSAKRARAPIARSLIISGEWRYSVGVTIVLLTPRVSVSRF